MTVFGDDEDVKADDLVAGRAAPGDEPLAAVLGRLRAMAEEPAPAPSPALAAVLRDGLPAAVLLDPLPATGGSRSRVLRGLRWAAGLGVAGKILLGAGVAAAAVVGTATLPVVPHAVQAPVRTALTDLGHLFPGSAGGSLPVPSPSTSGPVDRVGEPDDHPSGTPDGGGADEHPAGDGATRTPEPQEGGATPHPEGSVDGTRGSGSSTGGDSGSSLGGETPAQPHTSVTGDHASPLPRATRDQQDHGDAAATVGDAAAVAAPAPTPVASGDRSGSSSTEGDQSND